MHQVSTPRCRLRKELPAAAPWWPTPGRCQSRRRRDSLGCWPLRKYLGRLKMWYWRSPPRGWNPAALRRVVGQNGGLVGEWKAGYDSKIPKKKLSKRKTLLLISSCYLNLNGFLSMFSRTTGHLDLELLLIQRSRAFTSCSQRLIRQQHPLKSWDGAIPHSQHYI